VTKVLLVTENYYFWNKHRTGIKNLQGQLPALSDIRAVNIRESKGSNRLNKALQLWVSKPTYHVWSPLVAQVAKKSSSYAVRWDPSRSPSVGQQHAHCEHSLVKSSCFFLIFLALVFISLTVVEGKSIRASRLISKYRVVFKATHLLLCLALHVKLMDLLKLLWMRRRIYLRSFWTPLWSTGHYIVRGYGHFQI
jgi:hypothetical protein